MRKLFISAIVIALSACTSEVPATDVPAVEQTTTTATPQEPTAGTATQVEPVPTVTTETVTTPTSAGTEQSPASEVSAK